MLHALPKFSSASDDVVGARFFAVIADLLPRLQVIKFSGAFDASLGLNLSHRCGQ